MLAFSTAVCIRSILVCNYDIKDVFKTAFRWARKNKGGQRAWRSTIKEDRREGFSREGRGTIFQNEQKNLLVRVI